MPALMPRPPAIGLQSRAFWHPKIELRSIKKIRPAKRNARTHSKKQIEKLIGIIRRFGFINPIIIDENGVIVAGHLRREAAERLGMTHVPVICITHLSELEKKTFALAENRISLDSGWDREILAADLGELAVLLPEAEIELAVTAFDIAEIDLIIADHAETAQESAAADEIIPEAGPPVSRLHDLWVMARNRLYNGDARDGAAYTALMRGDTASMVFTDPPFNVSVKTHARGRTRDRFDEFVMTSGEMSKDQYQTFLEQALQRIADACDDGSIVYVCVDWRHVDQLLHAGSLTFNQLKNICIWVKSNAGQGSFYRSRYEMICVFKAGNSPHTNSFELGQFGRSRSNIWEYAGVNSFKAAAPTS